MGESTPLKLTEQDRKTIDYVNEAVMAREFSGITTLYVDLILLKELRLGLMLAVGGEQVTPLILKNLEQFNARLDRSFTSAFLEYPYPEQMLEEMIRDPQFSDVTFDMAPDTELLDAWYAYIKNINQRNIRSNVVTPPEITVNVYPIYLSPLVTRFADLFRSQLDKEIKIKFIREDPLKISATVWDTFDAIFVDNIAPLCGPNSPWAAPMEQMKWLKKHIYAPPVISKEQLDKWQEQKVNTQDPEFFNFCLDMTSKVLGCYCDFSFMHFKVPTPKTE